MPRKPKLWYWNARQCWYTQIHGKKIRLHEDKKMAEREFYRLMAAEGTLDPKAQRAMTLTDACEAYMATRHDLRKNTMILLERHLSRLAGSRFGRMKLSAVRPDEVIRWIVGMDCTDGGRVKSSGDAARHLQFRMTKTLFRWARNTGLIELDPFVSYKNPWKVVPRNRVMDVEEYVAVMSRNRVSDEFKEVVEFVWRTGIRPGELAALSARHLDSHLMIARFQPTEHKTGTKTGLQREVHFPSDLWERLKKYAEVRQAGPLIRRKNGKPWTTKAISNLWNQLKHSMGLECVLYQARHAFATDMMARGNPPEIVAKMLGHVRPDVLLSTYWHPAAEQMQQAVSANAADASEHRARIEARVEERKQEQVRKRRERNARWEKKQRGLKAKETDDE